MAEIVYSLTRQQLEAITRDLRTVKAFERLQSNVDALVAASAAFDGDKGDVTVSGGGSAWTIDDGVVTTSKMGGDVTAAGKALLDDEDAAAQRATLGLGTAATSDAASFQPWSARLTLFDASYTVDDNLNFSGVGRRITGDMTNATLANRLYFQTSTVNGATVLSVMPNGTGTASVLSLHASSDLVNFERFYFSASASGGYTFNSDAGGTGTVRAYGFRVSGVYYAQLFTTGRWWFGPSPTDDGLSTVRVNGALTSNSYFCLTQSGFGYYTGLGLGGTVTQLTNKTTAVTLNKISGEITMNNAALAADAVATFVCNNTSAAAADQAVACHQSTGTFGAYTINARCGAGTITFDVANRSTGSLSEAIVIRFTIIKSTQN